jgi:transcriptional regulator with XRE-family HTH domain
VSKSASLLIAQLKRIFEVGAMSKAEACRRTGFSASQLDAYLKGNSVPGLDVADRIAREVIGLPLWTILKGDSDKVMSYDSWLEDHTKHAQEVIAMQQQILKLTQEMAALRKALSHPLSSSLLAALSDPELAGRLQTTLNTYGHARLIEEKEGKSGRKKS